MAIIAFCSAKGSPGVTTTALALAATWPRGVVLAECDPAGADIAAGYFRGAIDGERGMAGLMSAARRGRLADELPAHLIRLDESDARVILPGLPGPAHTGLGSWWGQLAHVLAGLETSGPSVDVLVDCGRLCAPAPPTDVINCADAMVLVTRTHLASVHTAHMWRESATRMVTIDGAPHSRPGGQLLGLITIGDRRPYPADQIAAQLSMPLFGVLPWDSRTASVFSDGAQPPRGFWRSSLVRGATTLGVAIRDAIDEHRQGIGRPARRLAGDHVQEAIRG